MSKNYARVVYKEVGKSSPSDCYITYDNLPELFGLLSHLFPIDMMLDSLTVYPTSETEWNKSVSLYYGIIGDARVVDNAMTTEEILKDYRDYCASPESVGDKHYPNICPKCGLPAYIGLFRVDCSNPDCK